MASFFERHSKAINVVCSIALAVACLLMYVLLVILYLDPAVFGVDSLVHPSSQPSPQVIVALCSAFLVAASSALVTRCVEQFFWLKLSQPVDPDQTLTMGEVRDLAEWTVSPLRRFLYLFNGTSWVLKPTGILLLASAFVSTVLLSGISETGIETTSLRHQAATNPVRFQGWLDASNSRYNSGSVRDIPSEVAATLALSNLTAPSAATLCASDVTCRAEATVSTIRATCVSWTVDNTVDPVGCECSDTYFSKIFHSTTDSIFKTDYGVSLSSGSPYMYVNFSTAYIGGTYDPNVGSSGGSGRPGSGPGDFAMILGAWTTAERSPPAPINVVDCQLHFGTQRVLQVGQDTPSIVPDSFVKSKQPASAEGSLLALSRAYGEKDVSPWSFGIGRVSTGPDALYEKPVAFLLLGQNANRTAGDVAARIVKAVDMAALMSWARSPGSADVDYTQTRTVRVYVYQRWVLLMLLVPLLATVLGTVGKISVGGKDLVPGYDPLVIASRGPVIGVEDLSRGISGANEQKKVAGVFYEEHGVMRHGFICADQVQPMGGAMGLGKGAGEYR